MKILQTVSLEDVRVFAPIGFYEEEQMLGNEFIVQIQVSFDAGIDDHENLEKTVNYEILYQIIHQVMKPKRKLLESAAHEILQAVHKQFSFAKQIDVAIKKLNPPFGGDFAHSKVSVQYIL
ncbi:dihydroneopterin aldolase [Sphingobacterium sp. SRCM116780]|uniref:dihydroneopterin aldolase n=1 Tax=Sphingobacterium sp. SRCM116780 TaxID=2907623 RepID=UPI001F3A16E6|nr:dihydroneopterin aldolase [Sphingobacterium sp. SRCM116780]UIR57081.1 dihydroneopterin aldolase [Sphingobacterium sp. SRCM116780]